MDKKQDNDMIHIILLFLVHSNPYMKASTPVGLAGVVLASVAR